MSCRKCGRRSRGRLCRDCEIEQRAEERARATARDEDGDDDEGEDPVPLPDGGEYTDPTTDAEIDDWVAIIEDHADDTTVADHLGGIHGRTLRAEFGVERAISTIRRHLSEDDRVTTVLGFGNGSVRRSWAPAESDIGIGEDVASPRSRQPDTGQPCVVCGHAYDRAEHDECPQCTNGSVEDYSDVVADGGRIVNPADAALADRGIGDQAPATCPNGSVECAKPGTVPCPDCFLGGGDEDA